MTRPPPTRHPAFADELAELKRSDTAEAKAIEHAIVVLQTMGPRVGFPHTSAVRTSSQFALRELRPRRGRSRHRVLFATRGDPARARTRGEPQATRVQPGGAGRASADHGIR